jgi:hypothetical protein
MLSHLNHTVHPPRCDTQLLLGAEHQPWPVAHGHQLLHAIMLQQAVERCACYGRRAAEPALARNAAGVGQTEAACVEGGVTLLEVVVEALAHGLQARG